MMLASAIVCGGAITLEESIAMAREHNIDLQLAREEIEKARQTYYDVRGNLLPQITLETGYQLSRTNLPKSAIPSAVDFSSGLSDTASDDDEYLAGLMSGVVNSMIPSSPLDEASLGIQLKLTQVLFLGGKLINGIKAVDRYRSIQRLNYSLVEQEMVMQTTEQFYQCLLAGKLAQLQEEALATANLHLARVEAFHSEGMVSEYDLLRARLEVAKLSPQVLEAKNNYQLALAAFRKQIGTADASIVPEGEFVLPPEMNTELQEALDQGRKDRVELELADIATEVAQIKYNAEKGNYLPNVFLQGSYSIYTAADDFGIEGDDFGDQYSIGIGIQIPIFTGFSNTSKRKYAKSSLFQAKLQQRDYQELIDLEITQAWQNKEKALVNYRTQSENVKMAQRGLELAQVRYDNQVGIQLEVFDAQTTLAGIKLLYMQSIYEVIVAQLRLQKTMGIKL
jgi:outer membrane protein TolC